MMDAPEVTDRLCEAGPGYGGVAAAPESEDLPDLDDLSLFILHYLLRRKPAEYAHNLTYWAEKESGRLSAVADGSSGEKRPLQRRDTLLAVHELKKAGLIMLTDKGVHRITEHGREVYRAYEALGRGF